MVQLASELLQQEGVTPIARSILGLCEKLDDLGAWDVSLATVATTSAVLLLLIRLTLHKRWGVDWYALIHALVTGIGGVCCLYLDTYVTEALTGTPEPLRACQCKGPLTSLHRVLPAITLGYSLFDLADGLTMSTDFVIHGFATVSIFGYFVGVGSSHVIAPYQVMEFSTIFLALIRAEFFPEPVAIANMACFALSFFVFRVVGVTILLFKLLGALWVEGSPNIFHNCFHPSFFFVTVLFGILFTSLDFFWFYKIVQKIKRKLSGVEKTQESNDICVPEHVKKAQ